MKPTRDAAALAASLTSAAATPLPLPKTPPATVAVVPTPEPETARMPEIEPQSRGPKVKVLADTVAISLRPKRSTLERYTFAAAERTKKEGRVISAQQLMLEVLETGPKVDQ